MINICTNVTCKYFVGYKYCTKPKSYDCPLRQTSTGKISRQNDVSVIINRTDDMSEIMNIKEQTIIEAEEGEG